MEEDKKIKVLVIENSEIYNRSHSIGIISDSALQLVSSVSSFSDGDKKIDMFHPDVILISVEKITLANIFEIEGFIRKHQIPTLVVADIYELLSKKFMFDNIIAFLERPSGANKMDSSFSKKINEKIKLLAKNKFFSLKQTESVIPAISAKSEITSNINSVISKNEIKINSTQNTQFIFKPNQQKADINPIYKNFVIAFGSSTGGTEAFYEVITKLPANLPPILVVQHMPPVFTKMYADRLNSNCEIETREAMDGDVLYPGLALIAPGDYQMKVVKRGISLSVECVHGEKVSGHCPSVDVLFQSIADVMGRNSIGVIMTGMGKDGANGLLEMHKKGAKTVGQDEDSCIVYGMPKVALEIGAVDIQASPSKIPDLLQKILSGKA